jgi:hypothetical protein
LKLSNAHAETDPDSPMTTVDPSAPEPTPAPIDETLDLDKLEQRLVAGHPMVLIWRSEFNALVGEVRRLRARVEDHHCGGRAAVGE